MKLCKGCGGSLKRGWAGGGTFTSGSLYCLVCATARTMASFVYPPRRKKGH